ncbi:MAG TPA: hypothetical protein VGG90_01875 [Candidatus Dormibacteraeota bacterium]
MSVSGIAAETPNPSDHLAEPPERVSDPASTPRLDAEPPDCSWIAGFGAEDVAVNEEGRLSHAQRSRLKRDLGLGLLITLGISGIAAMALHTFGLNLPSLVWVFAAGCGAYQCLRDWTAIRESVVAQIDGDARVEERSDGESSSYRLLIAGIELHTNQDVFNAFVSGGPCRAFYLPASKRLVAVRFLPGWRGIAGPGQKKRWWQQLSIELG